MALQITWLTKIDGLDLDDPQKNVNASDMNEIKTVVNTNAATFDLFVASFIENEVPSGTVNGSNVTFNLANAPVSGSVKLYHNTVRLKEGVGYTLGGSTITFAVAPETGDIILVDYRKTI